MMLVLPIHPLIPDVFSFSNDAKHPMVSGRRSILLIETSKVFKDVKRPMFSGRLCSRLLLKHISCNDIIQPIDSGTLVRLLPLTNK